MRINILAKISVILLLTISFSACEDKAVKETQTQEVKYKASLPIPKWDENLSSEMGKYATLWHTSKHDPIPATQIGYAYANKLQDYQKALEWFEYSNSMKPTADNSAYACYVLQEMKQYDKAIKWCNDSIIQESNKEALFMLGTIYEDTQKYDKAIEYYKLSANKGYVNAMNNLGFIYNEKLKDFKQAEQWYLKAVKQRNYTAFNNIALFYHEDLRDDIKASAYAIALIGNKFSYRSVINLLKKDWQIPNETIKKGYELQLTSDEFPIKYKGDLGL
ncbi:tetratricopeptide repeat protein [Halarcobacter ebronensis]|uniref:beta-lactamase n=1 Tax=Halarcobacter ebronensis TaxID=1462615 RepID=A0A4Q1AI84_9BACT|nr:tetratricopeptide repeat protein [Halarcobacter ebronensis]QKF81473.1 tetratricopeptide repeat protein [Halarcobacter ebronensis]RXK02465.1 hypothetical protein CRV07_13425 [Halarcobacter ebronensis]